MSLDQTFSHRKIRCRRLASCKAPMFLARFLPDNGHFFVETESYDFDVRLAPDSGRKSTGGLTAAYG